MSEESIKTPTTSDNSLASKFTFIHNAKIAVEFMGGCLKQSKGTFTHTYVTYLFAYKLDKSSRDLNTNLN